MSQQPITRPPGWYADPIADGAQRWWDGRHWSADASAPDLVAADPMLMLQTFGEGPIGEPQPDRFLFTPETQPDPLPDMPDPGVPVGRGQMAARHWLILGGFVAALLIVAALTMDGSTALGLVLFVLLGALWLSPGIIASRRGHRNAGGIWVVTLLLGWTIVGWVVALAMALSDPGPRR